MKVSLLFPPTWHPSQPYLSLPSLTGFLAQGGVTNVSQRDLGIELLDKVVTHSYGVALYQELVDKQRMLEQERTGDTGPGSAEHLARVVESLDRFPYLIDRIEPAKETLRGEGFYDLESYKESLFLIDKWLEVLSALYFPTRLTVVDNQFGSCSKEFHLEGSEVEIQKKGDVLILRPKKKSWATFFQSLGKFSDDFMLTGRKQLPVQQRKRLFP